MNYLKNNLYADAYLEMSSNGALYNFFLNSIKSYNTTTYVPSYINKKYICDNADCSGSTSRYGTSGSTCSGGQHNGDIELNKNNFLSALNTGANLGVGKFHFIYHLDHSGASGIGVSSKDKGESIVRSDFDNLSNGVSYQILYSGGCNPANFQYDCIAKHYIINSNGGVAFIGNTDSGYQFEYPQLRYFLAAIYNPILKRYDIGCAFQNSAFNYSFNGNTWRLHLLGDPEMQVWTNTPSTFNVTVPTAITANTSSINVNVSGLNLPAGEKARICVQKGTEVYETSEISTNGAHTIPLALETAGTLYVTVTAHNYFPVEKTVTVNTSTAPNPVISSVNFIDDGTSGSIGTSIGNGNGQNDAGETIRLQAVIRNNGINTATGLTATLTCNSDSITITNASATLGNLASGASVTGQFLYQINKDMHERLSNSQNPVTLQLNITSSNGLSWTKPFNIDVFTIELKQRNKIIITPSNGNFGANTPVTFNIELQNTGQAPTTKLNAVLTSNNAGNIVSSCSSASRIYSTIGQFETNIADSAFQFTTGSAYTSNTTLNFTLTVADDYGKTTLFPFNLSKPNIVTGLKTSAKEHSIDLSWNSVSGASGYNIYRCNVGVNDTESGSYVRLNTVPVTFCFYNDADGLDALTKYYYKVTAVSQSGMESAPAQILAWTSYPTKGMYPVTMAVGNATMESHWVAEDVNNDGYKEIFSSISGGDSNGIGFLIALDWEGKELFDIDNNVTTNSGFADLSTTIRAGVAIADINNDGIKEIISVTRGFENNNMENLITCHIAADNNGDNKPDILWQVPVQRTFAYGAVIDNLDNSPDGSMEIVTTPCGNSTYHAPQIYNAQGNLIQELPINSGYSTYSAAAVADLDGDGDKEIITGLVNGIYIWHHDGTPFGAANPFYSLSGYSLRSSPVICDLNNDGIKEILVSASNSLALDSCRILAIKPNGQLLSGWGESGGANQYTSFSTGDLTKEIVVGDLNGDGNLEVVAVGADCVKIWNNTGTLYNTISLPNSGIRSYKRTPLLADIDGDPEIEIVVTSAGDGKIYGLKRNGSHALGFPLETSQSFGNATPVIADLDGNGKSEIIAGTGSDKKIYVWETNGNPNRIEWGSARHDSRNTGEYPCPPTIIQSNTTWNTSKSICGNLIVQSGTLTINNNANISMSSLSTVIVQNGATLYLNHGNLLNCNVKVLAGGHVILQNNAQVQLCSGGKWDMQMGATLDFQSGSIDR
ncbi:hypothetical protein FACS189463_0250 [Bacteroidia bacterium]|nr:hypothetical protein FACS189463_0250 [Bacteroidia bacterium]